MILTSTQQAFFAFLRAGLWQQNDWICDIDTIDFTALYQLSENQSVMGLVTEGIGWLREHNDSFTISKKCLLPFVGSTLQIEQKNFSKNEFLERLLDRLREKGIYAILVKGQGIAQCYNKPLWRLSGDIDLLLDANNYERAKIVLLPLAQNVAKEFKSLKHQGMTINDVVVELHGTFHSRLSKRIDKEIDAAQVRCLIAGEVRVWRCGETDIFLPSVDNDVLFVFSHILHHLFIEGIGLRQICDWCRLLWVYREKLDVALLEQRLRKMGLMNEWRAFASLAVDWLGMPVEAMPLYSSQFKKRGHQVLCRVLEFGNTGRKMSSSRSRYFIIGKIQSAWNGMRSFARMALILPLDSVRFFCHYVCNGIGLALTINR